ncbi:S1C family serine protease [Asticcacaulis solisilvae]|uniref:S1C family serine protease n=1 Tax=Asticcacaulis solisilvae TaxID=1217274 RepID=UPI003FD76A69
MNPSLFTQLSDSLADEVAAMAPRVAAIGLRHGRHLTATVWKDDLIVASEQALPQRDTFPVRLKDGDAEAAVVGRDNASNIALLRLDAGTGLETPPAGTLRTGGLALALGARRDAGATACLGVVNSVGPAWRSQRGGKIDAYIKLDLGMAAHEEGGPALDGKGGVAGMTTFGPNGQVLVIPHATVERVVAGLSDGKGVRRGWLGAALQPVAVPEAGESQTGRGFMIMSTAAGGPAEAAGLLPGDIVVAVDGRAVGHMGALVAELDADSIGKAVAVSVLRGGALQALNITIGEHPGQ